MRTGWVTVVLLGACYHPTPPGEVPCAANGACPDNLRCDMSRTPPICVEHLPDPQDAAVDAAPDTASDPDAIPDAAQAPAFAAQAHANGANVASLRYSLTVPPGSGRFLVVSVQLGSNCTALVPDVTSVTFANLAMARTTTITGTPCGMTTTRSDQWQLVAPPTGTNDVDIVLAGPAQTVHSGALAFVGIDQTTPVRASAIARGSGLASTVTVNSAPGDLVVNTIGQGDRIVAPGQGQTLRFLNNSSGADTLDNSAASTAVATGASTTMTWTFGTADEWQTISLSLQP